MSHGIWKGNLDRNNILNLSGLARFREIGIAMVHDNDSDSRVGPLLIVENFGRQSVDNHIFITGVAYEDLNNNGFYDPGEGVSDINISRTTASIML